jgi:hypothetical protein
MVFSVGNFKKSSKMENKLCGFCFLEKKLCGFFIWNQRTIEFLSTFKLEI